MTLCQRASATAAIGLVTAMFLAAHVALAASPPNLKSDIEWADSGGLYDSANKIYDARFGGVDDIETAFNHARREEEKQLGLTPGSLGDLDLPPQPVWDGMSDDAKALYLVNAERTARADMQPDVLGLPLAGIEAHIDAISHAYGDVLHTKDATGHYQDGTPTSRIERDRAIGSRHAAQITYPAPGTSAKPTHPDGSTHYFGDRYDEKGACHEFLSRSENLAYFASTQPIPLPLERAIYSFIYDDAGSEWGHREAVLLQDEALGQQDGSGYRNNHGSPASEGFMGFYVRRSNRNETPNDFYDPFGSQGKFDYGTVVVMNLFDPVADAVAGCSYQVTLRNEDLPTADGQRQFKANDDRVTTAINTAITFSPLDNDIGTTPADRISVTVEPGHGSVHVMPEQQLQYLPNANFSGTDNLGYRLTAADGRTSTATVIVEVQEAMRPSTARVTGSDEEAPASSTESAGTGGTGLAWLALLPVTRLARRKRRRESAA